MKIHCNSNICDCWYLQLNYYTDNCDTITWKLGRTKKRVLSKICHF